MMSYPLPVNIFELLGEFETFLETRNGLFKAVLPEVRKAKISQRQGYDLPFPQFARDGQRTFEIADRLLIIALLFEYQAQVVKGTSLTRPVLEFHEYLQPLLISAFSSLHIVT